MVFCLWCNQNVQSAPNTVRVCHSTCYHIKSLIVLALSTSLTNSISTPLYVFNVGFNRHESVLKAKTHTTGTEYPTTGHVYPECLPSFGLTSFLPSLHYSVFYQLLLSFCLWVFHYEINCALFKCKQDLMSFYVCSCVVGQRGRVLWTWQKSGQSPILVIILRYNGRHPQTWMTFIASLMTARERSSCTFVSVEACMIY